MIHLDIPEEAFWGALGFCFVVGVTSFVRFIRWQGIVLTKKEHADICTSNQVQAKKDIGNIVKMLEDQNTESGSWRTGFNDKMDKVTTDLANLKTDVRVVQALQSNAPTQINVTKGS